MVFANLLFLFAFLPLSVILYYASGNLRYRNAVLLMFSLFFYAWGEPLGVVLLLCTTALDYLYGLTIEKHRGTKYAKYAVAASMLHNIGLLVLFKYSAFFVATLNGLLGTALPLPSFMLPIGISFYSFKSISYILDVYREKTAPQRSYYKYLLYISLYFQLVAGPIARYTDMAHSLEHRSIDFGRISGGITRFCTGLAKKVVVANAAGELVTQYMDGDLARMTVLGSWFGVLMFTVQLYYDFSGYSDIAIGLGEMFGFTTPENFEYPYIAQSAGEFWRRWHISLGSFFRDYVYIPLGGNRKHRYANLLIVWLLTGLWHGASMNFVVWGLYYGALLILERIFLLEFFEKLPRFCRHVYMFFVITIGWALFYFTDFSRMAAYLGVMFCLGGVPFANMQLGIVLINNAIWLAVALIFCMPVTELFKYAVNSLPDERRSIVLWLQPVYNLLLLLACTALLVGQSYNAFLYFKF